jgi:hypothetical protein
MAATAEIEGKARDCRLSWIPAFAGMAQGR